MCRTQEEPGFLNEKWMFEDALSKYYILVDMIIVITSVKYNSTSKLLLFSERRKLTLYCFQKCIYTLLHFNLMQDKFDFSHSNLL